MSWRTLFLTTDTAVVLARTSARSKLILHHASSFFGGIFSGVLRRRLFLKGKPFFILLLDYVVAFYLKIFSLTPEQSSPQPKVSFRPRLNVQLKSFGFELLCFAFCRGRELFKLQFQMAAEDVNVIKYTTPLLFKCNLCIDFDAKKKRKPN